MPSVPGLRPGGPGLSLLHGRQPGGGPGYDAYLCRVIREAAGAREGYTTTTAVLKALEALGVRKLSICTPYPGDVNRMEKEYFENEGFTVAGIHGMETENPRDPKLIGRDPAGCGVPLCPGSHGARGRR